MLRHLLARIQEAILARPVRVLVASGLLVVLALFLGLGVEFRTSRSDLAPPDDPEQQRLERLVEEVGGSNLLIVCVERVEGQGKSLAELRSFTDVLAAELAGSPLVAKVFYRIPLEWFLERGLYLVPPATMRRVVDQVARQREVLGSLSSIRSLADLNEEITRGLEAGLENASAPPPEAVEGLSHLVHLLEAEARFLEAPGSFLAALEQRPPLLAVSGQERALPAEGYLATVDGSKLFLMVSPGSDDDSLPFLNRFVGTMRQSATRVSAERPGFKVAFTGEPAMTVEEMETVRRDTWFTSLVAVAGVAILTLLVFRWRSHVILVLASLAMGVIWAFGAVRLELGYLNLITSSFISTLVGVGVAYGIHPVSEYELEGAHTGDPRAAVQKAYHRTGAPVTVAAVTTSAAFFSILLMRFRGFAELGLVAGVGVLLCLIAAMVTLPAMLVVYGRRRKLRDHVPRQSSTSAAVDRFWVERGAAKICRYPRTVTAVAFLVTLGLGWSARGIEFNTNLLDLLPSNSEALEYQRRMVMESDLSPVSGMVVANSLDELRAMKARAEVEPSIQRFESVLQFLPSDPEASHDAARQLGELLGSVRLPERVLPMGRDRLESSLRDLEEALALTAESAFGAGLGELAGPLEEARFAAESAAGKVAAATQGDEAEWNDGQHRLLAWARRLLEDLQSAASAEPPRLETLPDEVRERFLVSEGRFLAFLQPKGSVFEPEVLSKYVEASRRVSRDVTGFPIVFHTVSQQITSGFYRAVAVGAVLVLLILLLDYRDVRDAGLAAVPLAVGMIWMMGFMGLLGLSFNFANLVAVPLIIGVGIDNGVHVVHRLRLEGREGMGVVLRHTGRAILIASLTTMIGFGSLALASHRGLASLGILLLLGVGSCLLTSTIVLPNLLVAVGKTRQ